NSPVARGLCQLCNGSTKADGVAEALAQSVRQHLQALVKGEFRGAIFGDLAAAFALTPAEDLAFDERAVTGFELGEFGEGVLKGKLMGVAGVNAGNERINRVVEKLPSKPADDEFGDGFLFAIAASRGEWLAQDGQLGARGEKPGGE